MKITVLKDGQFTFEVRRKQKLDSIYQLKARNKYQKADRSQHTYVT